MKSCNCLIWITMPNSTSFDIIAVDFIHNKKTVFTLSGKNIHAKDFEVAMKGIHATANELGYIIKRCGILEPMDNDRCYCLKAWEYNKQGDIKEILIKEEV